MRPINLKVGELTVREDFGTGIARLDARKMEKIGANEGDMIEVEGKRNTVVIATRSYPADIGLDIIRMDGLTRRNCKADIGDVIAISKAKVKKAKKVVLAPVDREMMVGISPDVLKQNLFMRPLSKDDIIISNPVFRSNNVFEQFFGVEEVFFPIGVEAKFKVIETIPKNFVQVDAKTEVKLMPEAVKDEIIAKSSRVPQSITFKRGKSIQEFKKFSKGLTKEEAEKILGGGSRKDFFCYKEKDGLWYLFKKI
jgi:transitional endoplasmic reticulum ATPase